MSELHPVFICRDLDFPHRETACNAALSYLEKDCSKYEMYIRKKELRMQEQQVEEARRKNDQAEEELDYRYGNLAQPRIVKPYPKATYTPPAQPAKPPIPGGMNIEPRRNT